MNSKRCIAFAAVSIGCLTLTAQRSAAQKIGTGPVTVNYPGIGPVTWSPVGGIKADLTVPQITAAPRVVCFDARYKCEITVQLRSISHVARTPAELLAEVLEQFPKIADPPPSGTVFQTVATPQLAEATFVDTRAGARYRFTTVALVLKGPAKFQVFAQGPDSVTVASMVSLARNVKLGTMREMMAYRFAQFVGVCNARVPATRAMNERALAASPFTDLVLLTSARQRDTTVTIEKLRDSRAQQLSPYLQNYDQLKPTSRQTFCSDLPAIIAATARELRAP